MAYLPFQLLNPGSSNTVDWNPGQSDDEYEQRRKSINQIATLQTPAALPDWLTTDPDSMMKELMDQYQSIPSRINGKQIGKAYDSAIGTATGMGTQVANNAAREAVARGGISGGQINSGMVKAQSMLPVYDTTSKLKTDKATAMFDAHKEQASMMTSIAGQLASLRTNYLSALGNIQTQRQNTQNSWVTGQEQLGQHQQESDRQYELTLAQLAHSGVVGNGTTGTGAGKTYPIAGAFGGGVATPAGVSDPGYVPTFGPVKAATMNGGAMRSPVMPWDNSAAVVGGWGTGAMGGGGGGKDPAEANTSVDYWLKMLGGGSAIA